jgi:hypothetical protein
MANDGHGRPLTTTAVAAGWYRLAQRRIHPGDDPCTALRRALDADAAFALAVVDLRALTRDAVLPRLAGPVTGWEHHHCEIVAAAVSGQVARAAALLRQHLSAVGCDPLALRIVADSLNGSGELDDLLAGTPVCHRRR